MLSLEEPCTVECRTPEDDEEGNQLNKKSTVFFWKQKKSGNLRRKETNRRNNEGSRRSRDMEQKLEKNSGNKISFNFLANVKKRLRIKMTYRPKQKMKCVDAGAPISNTTDNSVRAQLRPGNLSTSDSTSNGEYVHSTNLSGRRFNDRAFSNVSPGKEPSEETCTPLKADSASNNPTESTQSNGEDTSAPNSQINIMNNIETSRETNSDREKETNVADTSVERVEHSSCERNAVNGETRVKASLTDELLKLSKYGWYWGPISGDEADAKLISEPDGAFLVRDSSDDRYLLTLSFKSSGKLLHARMEHSNGLFSLCNQSENQGFSSVSALINHSMNFSQSSVFCYSRPKYPGHPAFPVRLTKPVSRFTQVRSLQYLCRIVIRQNTRLDNIRKLPLPNAIKGYIEEAHY